MAEINRDNKTEPSIMGTNVYLPVLVNLVFEFGV